MWPDNETERDFLNFSGVAATVAEIIVQADGRPISIGMSGAWGVGKSSMIKLVRAELNERRKEGATAAAKRDFIFVEFNAWLYQGYDDARAALVDVIAEILKGEAESRKTGGKKVQELLGRVVLAARRKAIGGPGRSPCARLASPWSRRSPSELRQKRRIRRTRQRRGDGGRQGSKRRVGRAPWSKEGHIASQRDLCTAGQLRGHLGGDGCYVGCADR